MKQIWCICICVMMAFTFHPVSANTEVFEPLIVINEMMVNPDAVSDARGEWMELYNTSSHPIDLKGWTVMDGKRDVFIIDEHIVVPPLGYVVLARCDDAGMNGGVDVDFEYSNMYLSNGGDTIILFDDNGMLHDAVTYSEERGFSITPGVSLELIDPLRTNTPGSHWKGCTTRYGDGDRGTPGACNSWYTPPKAVERPPCGALYFLFLKGIIPHWWT